MKLMQLKATEEIPLFVGTDMAEYGPWKEGEKFEVPENIARLLGARFLAVEWRDTMQEDLKAEITELVRSLQAQDSLEIGNSKTGTVKVYCNFGNPVEAENKIKAAIKVLKENRAAVLGGNEA